MSSLNKVFLMGNLTKDPELRYTPNGSAVASFGLAVNRKYKHGEEMKDEVCFVEIKVWNKAAENCAEYLTKGSKVLIEGRLHYQAWETEEGTKRSKLEVVANNVQFMGSSKGANNKATDSKKKDSQPAETGEAWDPDVPF